MIKLPVLETLRSYPRNLLVGIGAHIADTAVVYMLATFIVSYATGALGIRAPHGADRGDLLRVVVIALQPVYGALSDRIGRSPLNLFSVVFPALFTIPFFLLVDTGLPVLVVAGHLIVPRALGLRR